MHRHRHALPARRPFLILLASASALLTSACGSYLHRQDLQTTTADIKQKLGALSAPAYLEAQQQHLKALAAEEDAALAEYLVASRDFSLLNIVRDPAAGNAVGDRDGGELGIDAGKLVSAVNSELVIAVGTDNLTNPQRVRLLADSIVRRQATIEVDQIQGGLRSTATSYVRAGGTAGALTCDSIVRNPAPPAADPQEAKLEYENYRKGCASLQESQDRASLCTSEDRAGRIGRLCADLAAMREDKSLAAKKKELAQAAKALLEASKKKPQQTELQRQLGNLQGTITKAEALAAGEASADPLGDYKDILQGLDTLFSLQLTDALDTAIESGKSVAESTAAAETKLALRFLGAIADVAAPEVAPMDQPSALLIGLAKVRHDLNLVDLEIGHRQRLAELYTAQATALRSQISYLVRAQKKLCSGMQRCPATRDDRALALSYYMSSFNSGLIPFEILRFRETQLKRNLTVQQAKVTEADYRALIQPAIDQLAAYGEGGLKPEMIAPFIANLPVAGAIFER